MVIEQLTFASDPDAICKIYVDLCKEAEAPYRHLSSQEFQKLSANQKFAIIDEINRRGNQWIHQSPYCDDILALQEANEETWRQAQLKVIAAYKVRHPEWQPSA